MVHLLVTSSALRTFRLNRPLRARGLAVLHTSTTGSRGGDAQHSTFLPRVLTHFGHSGAIGPSRSVICGSSGPRRGHKRPSAAPTAVVQRGSPTRKVAAQTVRIRHETDIAGLVTPRRTGVCSSVGDRDARSTRARLRGTRRAATQSRRGAPVATLGAPAQAGSEGRTVWDTPVGHTFGEGRHGRRQGSWGAWVMTHVSAAADTPTRRRCRRFAYDGQAQPRRPRQRQRSGARA